MELSSILTRRLLHSFTMHHCTTRYSLLVANGGGTPEYIWDSPVVVVRRGLRTIQFYELILLLTLLKHLLRREPLVPPLLRRYRLLLCLGTGPAFLFRSIGRGISIHLVYWTLVTRSPTILAANVSWLTANPPTTLFRATTLLKNMFVHYNCNLKRIIKWTSLIHEQSLVYMNALLLIFWNT